LVNCDWARYDNGSIDTLMEKKSVQPRKTPQKSIVPAATTDGTDISAQHMLLGPPALITGEDPAAYEDLRARISAAVKPADFLEEIWVRDVVDLTWDTLRMRRLKVVMLTSTVSDRLKDLLTPMVGRDEAARLSKEWSERDRSALKQVDKQLTTMGLTMDAPVSQILARNIDQFERVDRMIMNAEARRNAALREVDRHRSSLAQALRRASDDIVEAEYEELAPQQPVLEDAA
jgi:hypothetical protein